MESADKKVTGPPRLSLDGPLATRKTIARLVRLRFRGGIDSGTFRDCLYGLNTALGYDKLLADLRIEERLAEIEARLASRDARPSPAPASRPAYAPAPAPDTAEPEDEEDAPTAAESAISETPATSTDWRTRL